MVSDYRSSINRCLWGYVRERRQHRYGTRCLPALLYGAESGLWRRAQYAAVLHQRWRGRGLDEEAKIWQHVALAVGIVLSITNRPLYGLLLLALEKT